MTTSMLEWGDKTIDKIWQILSFIQAKFINKQATGITGDLAIVSRRRNTHKKRATIDNKCFNCGRLRHFGRDGIALSTRKKNKADESSGNNNGQHRRNNRPRRNRANIATATTTDDDKSAIKLFQLGIANMAKYAHQQAPEGIWYLDSYTSYHLTNNKDLFVDELRPKCLDFTIANGQTLRTKNVVTITILLVNRSSIKLEGVVYAPEYDSNLILLGQLRDNNITYIVARMPWL